MISPKEHIGRGLVSTPNWFTYSCSDCTMEMSEQLTSLQLELLKAYAFDPSEEELLQVKALLGNLFANRLVARVDQSVEEKGITNADLDSWLNDEDQ